MEKNPFYKNNTFKFVLLIVLVIACGFLGKLFNIDVQYFRELLARSSIVLSFFIFVFLYVFLTFFVWFGPKDVLRVGAAVLFGAYISTFFVVMAELINAVILFQLSRKLGRDYIVKKFRLKEKDMDKIKDDSSIVGAFALRINLLVPLRFIDLGYGLTKMPVLKYIIAGIFSTPIRIFIQQYIFAAVGDAIYKDPAYVVKYLQGNKFIFLICFSYVSLLIIVSIIALIKKFAKKKSDSRKSEI